MIYFIRDTATCNIKIGYSSNPRARLSQVQTHCPGAIELLAVEAGGPERERELHATFADARARGEWFYPTAPLLDHIAALPPLVERVSEIQAFWGGKTAKQVAEITGISPEMISHIRLGRRRPSPETAIAIQRATGVSAIRLVFGELADEAA